MPHRLANPELLAQVQEPRELGLQVHMSGPKRVSHPVVLAILDKLLSVVFPPRAKQRIRKRVPPLFHRFQRHWEERSACDLALRDTGQLGTKRRQLGMSNRAHES